MAEYIDMGDGELFEALRERVRTCVSHIPHSHPDDGAYDSYSILHILDIIKERLADDVGAGRPLRPLFRPIAETMAVMEKHQAEPVLSMSYSGRAPAPLRTALALQALMLPEAALPATDWERLVETDRRRLEQKALVPG